MEDRMAYYNEEALKLHKALKGKVEVKSKCEVKSLDKLSLLYSPGVAAPCIEISKDPEAIYDYTWKGNTVAIVSDGSAVLGLGNIGPKAGLPVMEGKSLLFKNFANVNAVPIMLDVKNPDKLIETVEAIAPTFGGINLEDIKAPDCFYIEEELKSRLDIPVFHDDQHGTAIVVLAALINAFKYMNKNLEEAKVVVSGTGAAGSAIIQILNQYGVDNIYAYNREGVVNIEEEKNKKSKLSHILPYLAKDNDAESLSDLLVNADVFIGVSASDILSEEDIKKMNFDPVIFALANPKPEIPYELAKKAGAAIVGTGRSDYPNQINNVLAFPGVFKGALSVQATEINDEMKLEAAQAIARVIPDEDISESNIIPKVTNKKVVEAVADAVSKKAVEMGVIRNAK